MLVARGYNFACVKKCSNCITVPTLLSMIVAEIFCYTVATLESKSTETKT